ncbi:MAG: TfoX/Sxy family protein [Rhodothermales bacterium]
MGKLKNIGPTMTEWLHEIGIHTKADLEDLGAAMAYKMLKHRRPKDVNILALYALQGAIMDVHWNALPPEVKDRLKRDAQEPLHVSPGP